MKAAARRLTAAALSLTAAGFELAASLLELAASLALRAAATVRPRRPAPPPRAPTLRVVPTPPSGRTRLTIALGSLGWGLPAVRRFVDGLGDRTEREPVADLIREGITHFSRCG